MILVSPNSPKNVVRYHRLGRFSGFPLCRVMARSSTYDWQGKGEAGAQAIMYKQDEVPHRVKAGKNCVPQVSLENMHSFESHCSALPNSCPGVCMNRLALEHR